MSANNKGREMADRQPDGGLSNGEIMNSLLKDAPDMSHTSRALAKSMGLWADDELDQMFGPERR